MKLKTRCKECLYANNMATEEPCNSCSEIQHITYKCDNKFTPLEKNINIKTENSN